MFSHNSRKAPIFMDIGIGVAIGAGVAVALHNYVLGASLGIIIALVFTVARAKRYSN